VQYQGPDVQAISAFLQNLERYAADLDEADKLKLKIILYSALDPLQRMRLCRTSNLLDAQEQEILQSLLDEGGDNNKARQ